MRWESDTMRGPRAPKSNAVGKKDLEKEVDGLADRVKDGMLIQKDELANLIEQMVKKIDKNRVSPLYLSERIALNEDHERLEQQRQKFDEQIAGFTTQIQEHIDSNQTTKKVYETDREAYKTALDNLENKFAENLKQIDSKYSQNTHNPVDQLLIEEKLKRVDTLTIENKKLRTALSKATGFPSCFDGDDENARNLLDEAIKTRIIELASRLELQISTLVNEAPWNVRGIVSSRPHLDGDRAIQATKSEMMAVISTFIFLKTDALRLYQMVQPSTTIFFSKFPQETAAALHEILMTRVDTTISMEHQAVLRSCVLDVLTTAADLAMLLGYTEPGKSFQWVQNVGQVPGGLSNDELFDYSADIRGSHDASRGPLQVIFGAITLVQPEMPPLVLYKGKITSSQDLPSNFDDTTLRSGMVEEILLRNMPEPLSDPTYSLFDPGLLQNSSTNAVAQLYDEMLENILWFCQMSEEMIDPYPSSTDACCEDIDYTVYADRERWISNLRAAIASWIATFLSSLRLDILENTTRTRRIFSSLVVVVQATMNCNLAEIFEADVRYQEGLHDILESAHRLSRHINRYPHLGWMYRWHQISRSSTPWLDDEAHWECILCKDEGPCNYPEAPGGFVVCGKLIHELFPPIPGVKSKILTRSGLFIHGDESASPDPKPSDVPYTVPSSPNPKGSEDEGLKFPPRPTVEDDSDDGEL